MIGVVICQHIGNGNALRIQRGFGQTVYIATRCVGWAVCTVRTDGENGDVRQICDTFGGSERQFLIAAAFSVSRQMNDGFSAENISTYCLLLERY